MKKRTILIIPILSFALLAAPIFAEADDSYMVIEDPTVEEIRTEDDLQDGSGDSLDDDLEELYNDFIIDEDSPERTPAPTDDSRPTITSLTMPPEFIIGAGIMEINATINMSGQLFLTLFTSDMTRVGAISTTSFEKGSHKIEWNGQINGNPVSAGNYIIQASLKSQEVYSKTLEFELRIDVIPPIAEIKSFQSTFTTDQKSWESKVNVNQKGKLTVTFTPTGGTAVTIYDKECASGDVTVTWDGKLQSKAAAVGKYTVTFKLTTESGFSHSASAVLEVKDASPQVSGKVTHTSPVVVLKTGEKTLNKIMSKPGAGNVLGQVYGSTVGLTVHGYSGNFALVSARDYDTNKQIKGYIAKSMLVTVEPTPGYVVIIDKKTQRLTVYKNGKVSKTMKISTGLTMETPNGEFLTGARLAGFESHGLWARYATRFNGGIYYHEVPSKDGDYTRYENQLGKKASAGCVRVPRGEAKWLYDNIPKGTKVIVQ